MAGGRSRRMRAGGESRHKCLLEVLGVPLLERNVCRMLACGFRDVVIVTSADEPTVTRFAETRCRNLAEAVGVSFRCVIEQRQLGTIGVVRELTDGVTTLVLFAADNLTALDLCGLVTHHRSRGAAMTVATHEHPFQIPYGQVEVIDGCIRSYLEKPTHAVRVSSGIYALDVTAAQRIEPETRCDAPALITDLLGDGHPVAAFEHNAAWTDVNDQQTLDAAEHLVAANASDMEVWPGDPNTHVAGVVMGRDASDMRMPRCEEVPARLPVREVRGTSPRSVATSLAGGQTEACVEPLAVFDELSLPDGRVVRHHIFAVTDVLQVGEAWTTPDRDSAIRDQPLRRVIGYWRLRKRT